MLFIILSVICEIQIMLAIHIDTLIIALRNARKEINKKNNSERSWTACKKLSRLRIRKSKMNCLLFEILSMKELKPKLDKHAVGLDRR